MDRPLRIIEAVARAKGLQTSTGERGVAEGADLSHSFLIRQGKRVPVNLERLFYEGDFSQNIALEPNDYLYFAPAAGQEIYVLGEVVSPFSTCFARSPSPGPPSERRGTGPTCENAACEPRAGRECPRTGRTSRGRVRLLGDSRSHHRLCLGRPEARKRWGCCQRRPSHLWHPRCQWSW